MDYLNVSIKCPKCQRELYKCRMSIFMCDGNIYLQDKYFDIEDEIEFDSHDPERCLIVCDCGFNLEFVDIEPFEHRLH